MAGLRCTLKRAKALCGLRRATEKLFWHDTPDIQKIEPVADALDAHALADQSPCSPSQNGAYVEPPAAASVNAENQLAVILVQPARFNVKCTERHIFLTGLRPFSSSNFGKNVYDKFCWIFVGFHLPPICLHKEEYGRWLQILSLPGAIVQVYQPFITIISHRVVNQRTRHLMTLLLHKTLQLVM
ncbi:hypothetical protein ASE73_07670 [Sphingomonas sp. Leaf24]|nr:hypothetical protein ASE50_16780 [Sphingomonas sp. Leaf5]KQM89454.1 hypothetical protein ASE73_07670 [Sphingomonas sp. Leaf24]